MVRTSTFLARFFSFQGIAALALVSAALVLPACGGANEGLYEEDLEGGELYEEEGLGTNELEEDVELGEEEELGEEGIGDE